MRVLTILLRFGTDRYADAAADLDEWFRRRLPGVERVTVIVDNALPASHVEQGQRHTLIGGDNTAAEFSGFDRAVEFVGREIWDYDFVLFATSAFKMLYVEYLNRFSLKVLASVRSRSVCLGHIDSYVHPVEIVNCSTQHWIRSCIFFMPPCEVKALGRFAIFRDGAPFFSGVPDTPFRADAPLNGRYRDYIIDWLTGKDIGQGVTWHSSFALSYETLPAFERKALAIMNEQMLGVRLRAMGCRLIDVTWLASLLERNEDIVVPLDTCWQDQLANRGGAAKVSRQVFRPWNFVTRVFPLTPPRRIRETLSAIVSRYSR